MSLNQTKRVWALILGLAVGIPSLQAAEDTGSGVMQSLESEIQLIFNQTKESVVQVKTILPVKTSNGNGATEEALSIGTGFFVDGQGHIFTSASIIRGSSKAVVYWKGKSYEAVTVGQDPRTNLALLKIEAKTPSLPFGNPDQLKVGSTSLAVGFPADGPVSIEYGVVSNTDTVQLIFSGADSSGMKGLVTSHIRTSIRVHPGQSGSPLLNNKGEVVGMVVAAMEDGGSTLALPISAARKIEKDLLKYGGPHHGWTGLTIEARPEELNKKGGHALAIRDVFEGCPGHVAGIHKGDVLLKIGQHQIETPSDVMNATFYLSVGETVNYEVQRGEKVMTIPVKVSERPNDHELIALKPVDFHETQLR